VAKNWRTSSPNLTADRVAAWEEIFPEGAEALQVPSRTSVTQLRAPLCPEPPAEQPQPQSVRQSIQWAGVTHTVRVDWLDEKQSLIRLPDKLFQHLAMLLNDRQIVSAAPAAAFPAPTSDATPPRRSTSWVVNRPSADCVGLWP
jgi:hypothetical protein